MASKKAFKLLVDTDKKPIDLYDSDEIIGVDKTTLKILYKGVCFLSPNGSIANLVAYDLLYNNLNRYYDSGYYGSVAFFMNVEQANSYIEKERNNKLIPDFIPILY